MGLAWAIGLALFSPILAILLAAILALSSWIWWQIQTEQRADFKTVTPFAIAGHYSMIERKSKQSPWLPERSSRLGRRPAG
jgi:hypothetical protein